MLSGLAGLVAGFVAKLLAQLVADWRRDRANQALGQERARAEAATIVAEKERAYAEIASRGDDPDATARRLRDGQF